MKNKIEELLKLLYAIKENEKEKKYLSQRDSNLHGWHQRSMQEKQEENLENSIRMQKKYDALLKEFYEMHHAEFENEIQPEFRAVRKLLEFFFGEKCDQFNYDNLSNWSSGKSIPNILNQKDRFLFPSGVNLNYTVTVEAWFPGTGGSSLAMRDENRSKYLSVLFDFPVYVEVQYGYHNSVKFDLPWYVIPILNQTLKQHDIDLGEPAGIQIQEAFPISSLPYFSSSFRSTPKTEADNTLSTEALQVNEVIDLLCNKFDLSKDKN